MFRFIGIVDNMVRQTHVFIVDSNTYVVHTERGFCGVLNPKGGGRLGLLTDIKAFRKGDRVIFYQRRINEPPLKRGFRDVFKIVSDPFYDDTTVEAGGKKVLGKCPICGYTHSGTWKKVNGVTKQFCSNPDPNVEKHEIPITEYILPYRVLIEPVKRFDRPIDDNTAYIDVEDEGELPTLRWRKVTGEGTARSSQRILPEEAEKLIRLMAKVNNERENTQLQTNTYISVADTLSKLVPKTLEITRDTSENKLFSYNKEGKFYSEAGLEAWMMENIDKSPPVLSEVIGNLGELEFFGNNVMYGVGRENADILLLHKKDGKRFKATVFELKKDNVNEDTVDQVLNPENQNYAKWIGQLVTANCNPPINSLTIQPVMVGFKISQDTIDRLRYIQAEYNTFSKITEINYSHRNRPNVKITVLQPILLSYNVQDNNVKFTRISYQIL